MTAVNTNAILRYLKGHLSPSRLAHVRAVQRTAERLARIHGVPLSLVTPAALLHDAARNLAVRDLVAYVRKNKVAVPCRADVVRHNPLLLHSFVSADIARRRFGIRNRKILAAVALHTVAGRNMDALAKLIYLADSISADRHYPAAEKIRRAGRADLDRAFHMALANKIAYVLARNAWLHPASVQAWNELAA